VLFMKDKKEKSLKKKIPAIKKARVPPSVRAVDQLEKERIREEKERIKAEKLNKKQMEKHGGLLETQEGDKEKKE